MRPFGVKVSLIEPGFHKTNITNTENLKKSLYASFEQAPKYVQDEYGKEFLEQGVYALRISNSNKVFKNVILLVKVYIRLIIASNYRLPLIVCVCVLVYYRSIQYIIQCALVCKFKEKSKDHSANAPKSPYLMKYSSYGLDFDQCPIIINHK